MTDKGRIPLPFLHQQKGDATRAQRDAGGSFVENSLDGKELARTERQEGRANGRPRLIHPTSPNALNTPRFRPFTLGSLANISL